ncbi:MAG TPA: CocE/NonD family hydrolase [candidate division Zixibacteria bacterium]|nr:CocE/NonD family hydrolase [candidate division Zixibacteria bacterium]
MKLKKQTKETIQIIAFFLIAGGIVFFYMVYPLNRTKALMGRPNLDDYKERADSVIANDASLWIENGLSPDTFRVETDGLTELACLRCLPNDSVKGTVIILHYDRETRDSVLPLALAFWSSGYAVIACDQRASGNSSGNYTGDGWYEANDLKEVIAYLDLRNELVHPVCAIGFGLGADAAILSALDENRIDAVAAMDPYLTSGRWLEILKNKNGMFWYPFWKSVTWWYYNLRSSYAALYRDTDNIQGVRVSTILFVEQAQLNDSEVIKLKELSSDSLLTIHPTPFDESGKLDRILEFVKSRK